MKNTVEILQAEVDRIINLMMSEGKPTDILAEILDNRLDEVEFMKLLESLDEQDGAEQGYYLAGKLIYAYGMKFNLEIPTERILNHLQS